MAMLRLASSKVVPNAVRAIASPRILSGSITNAFSSSDQGSLVKRETPFVISRNFSTGASTDAKKQIDHKLVKILKSEIKQKQYKQSFLEKIMPATPADFPFTIQDYPCERNITLTREFDGEKIDVVVVMPSNIPGQDDEDESDFSSDTDTSDDDSNGSGSASGGDDDDGSSSTNSNYSDEEEMDQSPSLTLEVTISKENKKKLEFEVSASANEIKINSMSFKEPAAESSAPLLCFGPHFVGEDGDLPLALKEFLEIRGIKEANYGFLYEYMVRKSKKRPMLALKKLRKFIKE